MSTFYLIILSYFLVGFFSGVYGIISSYFEGNDIKVKNLSIVFIFLLFGFISPIIIIGYYFDKYGDKTLIKGRKK